MASRYPSLVGPLEAARNEKDVENAYRGVIGRTPDVTIESPCGSDGVASWGDVRLLMEFKHDVDFKDRTAMCRVVAQAVHYLYNLAQAGFPPPNVVLCGDRNEAIVFPVRDVEAMFAIPGILWEKSDPSSPDPTLVAALVKHRDLAPVIENPRADFGEIVEAVEKLAAAGGEAFAKVTLGNIRRVFEFWLRDVFVPKRDKLNDVQRADLFLRALEDKRGIYLHPTENDLLQTPNVQYPAQVTVSAEGFRAFERRYVRGTYSFEDIRSFNATRDQLLDLERRRFRGDFYTNYELARLARVLLVEVIPAEWRAGGLVLWDPAAGTGNLAEDFDTPNVELVLSTLEPADVAAIQDQAYADRAVIFRHDFLGKGDKASRLPHEVEDRLREWAAAGKTLVFFYNPPYSAAGDGQKPTGTHKEAVDRTWTKAEMDAARLGHAARNLYQQFLFKASRTSNDLGFERYAVGAFTPLKWLRSGANHSFREWWHGRLNFGGGMMVSSEEFNDTHETETWAVGFTVWLSNGAGEDVPDSYPLAVFERSGAEGLIPGTPPIRRITTAHGNEASSWAHASDKAPPEMPALPLVSGLNAQRRKGNALMRPDAFGYMQCNANDVGHATQGTTIVTGYYANRQGFDVVAENYRRALALYAVRHAVVRTWRNESDEFIRPSPAVEKTARYRRWNDAAIIYALFHRKNNATSLRGYEFEGKNWDVFNHFFWLTPEAARDRYREAGCKTASKDLVTHKGHRPYTAEILPTLTLGKEARAMLEWADALHLELAPQRDVLTTTRPDLHPQAWDAGWYQLNMMAQAALGEERVAPIEDLRRALRARILKGVYEFGFLEP